MPFTRRARRERAHRQGRARAGAAPQRDVGRPSPALRGDGGVAAAIRRRAWCCGRAGCGGARRQGGAGLRAAARASWATARSSAVRASALTPSCVLIALCEATPLLAADTLRRAGYCGGGRCVGARRQGGAGLRAAAWASWATARSSMVRASALTPSCVLIALCAALVARRGALLLLSSVPVLRQQHASTDRVARAARTSFCLAEAEDGRPRFVALATSFESPAASGTHLWALLRLRCCCLSLSKCSGSIAVT